MNRINILLFVAAVCLSACTSSNNQPSTPLSQAVLIPKPVSVTDGDGAFQIDDRTAIYISGESDSLKQVADYFSKKLSAALGKDVTAANAPGDSIDGTHILFVQRSGDPELGSQGYEMTVTAQQLKIKANTAEGVFNGIQTLLQMLPADFGEKGKTGSGYAIAGGVIRDYPEYAVRGAMLDVARHFFSVDDVKHYIDLLASYKMNTLHLHLSDDQGWRIEIKSWPNLANHGGGSEVGGGKGGFYTQDQYTDIVRYAQDRYITIIPEIDMPGHTNAALSSYPELNCNDSATKTYTGIEVGFSSLCVRKDVTYKFIDDVVRELSAITPGPYIHLGGDESHATKKEDFIYFINKILPIPGKYGKKMIGWEEIAQANVDSSTIVQYWSNAQHAIDAVKKGAKIMMSPATKVYLDMKYDSTTKLGQDWAARIEVDSAYNWKLSNRVNGIPKESILGIEAPLWTETITNMDEIEYMVFPRLPGVAEVGWSPESQRNWDEYKVRLGKHGARMKALGINFYESKQVDWAK
jgi:hexosaminidase